mmetsp:Transcript_18329/g.25348  ORF Transcript_18329/g.25348 Transcript_18329/m.25348 type:complete len:112 (-) Transcript_18329:983-1318(-)
MLRAFPSTFHKFFPLRDTLHNRILLWRRQLARAARPSRHSTQTVLSTLTLQWSICRASLSTGSIDAVQGPQRSCASRERQASLRDELRRDTTLVSLHPPRGSLPSASSFLL